MAGSGTTITDSLNDSIPNVKAQAIKTREYVGVMTQLVDRQTLAEGTGTVWNEPKLAKVSAQNVQEDQEVDNPQQLSDTEFTVTPEGVVLQTLITDRVGQRISKNSFALTGGLAQEGIERKKDEDGLAQFASFTTALVGTGSTLASGHISAATSRIMGNATEPGPKPLRFVGHPFQIKDIEDELNAAVGTFEITAGVTAQVFSDGFSGMIAQAQVFADGNITIDSTPDARGAVFSKMAVALIQASAPDVVLVRKETIGLGATLMIHRDEYAYGIRNQNWGFSIFSDATVPTS